MNKSMIATRPMTYGTRRLKAGDGFTAASRDADLLQRLGRARYADGKDSAPKSEKRATDTTPKKTKGADDLTELRKQYQEVVGKRPFHGWDAETLAAKIAEAKA